MQPTSLKAGQKWTDKRYWIVIIRQDTEIGLVQDFYDLDSNLRLTSQTFGIDFLLKHNFICISKNVKLSDFEEVF